MIDSYSGMSPSFKEKSLKMFNKVHPIEMGGSLPLKVEIPLMIEWFYAKHELMIQNNLHKKDFELMVKESHISFRYIIANCILNFKVICIYLEMVRLS